MDNFEKYIQENKKQLDQHEPKDIFWDKIAPELEEKKPKNDWLKYTLRVAAILLLGVGIGWLINQQGSNQQLQANNNEMELAELGDAQSYYTSLIDEKLLEIEKSSKMTKKDKDEFLTFMEDLDQEYAILKESLKENINNERVIEAILENYKTRIDVLESLINRLNEQQNLQDDESKVYI